LIGQIGVTLTILTLIIIRRVAREVYGVLGFFVEEDEEEVVE